MISFEAILADLMPCQVQALMGTFEIPSIYFMKQSSTDLFMVVDSEDHIAGIGKLVDFW